jgi:hypothetical protein
MTPKGPRTDRENEKIDQSEIKIYVRLAAIPQLPADAFPFQTAHQATP